MIEIKNLSKRFANERAINYKDMTFEDGKSYMLLGASGCGKSTLLNMIAGILSADAGEIYIDGVNMSEATQKQKDKFRIQKIGYIFQDFKLITDMTVADNIGIQTNLNREKPVGTNLVGHRDLSFIDLDAKITVKKLCNIL